MTLDAQKVINEGLNQIREVIRQADSGQLVWHSMEVPNEGAMRAFQGVSDDYVVCIAQANVEGMGVVHEGIVTCKKSVLVIRLPAPEANKLYHQAAASQN
jgi:hypothetical protein